MPDNLSYHSSSKKILSFPINAQCAIPENSVDNEGLFFYLQDFRFSQQWLWTFKSSGLLHCVFVSEEHTPFTLKV